MFPEQMTLRFARLVCGVVIAFAIASCNKARTRSSAADDVASDAPLASDVDAGEVADVGVDAPIADVGPDDAGDASPPTDASGDAGADTAPDVPVPRPPARIDTLVSDAELAAGDTFSVRCVLEDDAGDAIELAAVEDLGVRVTPSDAVEAIESGEATAAFRTLVPTTLQVACDAPSALLLDVTPVAVQVVPGPVASTVAQARPNTVVAGEPFEVACFAFDALGNAVPGALTPLATVPNDPAGSTDGSLATLTVAGRYEVVCDASGADTTADIVDVAPAAPASLRIAAYPESELYALGAVVAIESEVADRFGNVVAADVVLTSEPLVEGFGPGRLRLTEEGTILVRASVESAADELPDEGSPDDEVPDDEVPEDEVPEDEPAPLEAELALVVNGNGPAIACTDPIDGAVLNRSPSGVVTLEGRVRDPLGVRAVTVDGALATLEFEGEGPATDAVFRADVPVEFGIHFVDIAALDETGVANSTVCSFLVADRWVAPSAYLDDSVTLSLGQNAIDDGDRSGPVNSLGDLLHDALASDALVRAIDDEFSGVGQIANECVIDGGFLGCILRVRVNYRGAGLDGPNDVDLDLVDGGLRARLVIRRANVRINIDSSIVDTTGPVRVNEMEVDVTFNVGLSGGRPRVTYRSTNNVRVSGISTDFGGLDGDIVDFVFPIFEGQVRDAIRDAIVGYIESDLDDLLDDIIGGLDIASLGGAFDVPRLDGGDLPLSYALRFSQIDVTPTRALFGVGTRLSAPPERVSAAPGAPLPPGAGTLDPVLTRSVAAAVQVPLLNQALYALWEAGFLDASVGADLLGGGLPEGLRATLATQLPPVAVARDDGRVEATIGAVDIDLVYPGFFDDPLRLRVGASATLAVRLDGDTLRFDDVALSALRFATPDASLPLDTRLILEDFLESLMSALLTDVLNEALPSLPIPAFELPESLDEFGLPGGSSLGIQDATLATQPLHFVLQGNFGVQ